MDTIDEIDVYTEKRAVEIWKNSNMMYGSRKISAALAKESIFLSRYQVGKVMKTAGICSLYNKKRKFKPYNGKSYVKQIGKNIINQKFNSWNKRQVISSNLTYVKCSN